ncbi:MAG: hypothetical protein U0232_08060 [Thermomicrobiales bacterium]
MESRRRKTAAQPSAAGAGAKGQPVAASSAANSGASLRIALLGTFQVSVGEQAIPAGAWKLTRARSLVGCARLRRGTRLSATNCSNTSGPTSRPRRR